MAVAVGLVDTAYRGPVFRAVVGKRAQAAATRVAARGGRVRVPPLPDDQHLRGVRRVLQRVVSGVVLAGGDLVDLRLDRDHRVTELIDLGEVLAFRRLDHERAGYREGHGRRVE